MTARVLHPGPAAGARISALACRVHPLRLSLPAGAMLADVAFAAPSAWLRFAGPMAPLRYVIPADAPDACHAAWYSATCAPPGESLLRGAGLFTGPRDGAPFLHCHGEWDVAEGPRAGHVLPHETRLAAETRFAGWRIDGAQMQAAPDAETNFTLYLPRSTKAAGGGQGLRAVLVRVAPNEEIGPALAQVCAAHGITRARVEGIGSLNGARMADGRAVPPGPTEFLVRDGHAAPTGARLDIVLVDRAGAVTTGVLAPLGNPVFVTCEMLLIAEGG